MSSPIPASFLALAGYKCKGYELHNHPVPSIILSVEKDRRYKHICSNCESISSPNRRLERRVRDLGIFDKEVFIDLEYFDVLCPNCKVRVERILWVSSCARVTTRFEEAVGRLCKAMSLLEVAEYFGLDWKTVKAIDKAYLNRTLQPENLDNIRVIGVDEVAKCKGHNYLTIVYDLRANRLLWIGDGRSKETLGQFFELLGPERCKEIEAIAIDMGIPYQAAIRDYCPDAFVVYDKFHVIANYSKVIDKVRNQEFKKASLEDKTLLKGTKYLLLRNRENLKEEQKPKLEELLSANKTINTVYALKEQLQALWDNYTVPLFNKAIDQWCSLARESGISHLAKFADSLVAHRPGLWHYCLYPISTAKLEANNVTIGLIRKRARGFRDTEYFMLKIRQALS